MTTACASHNKRQIMTFTVLTSEFMHESNTFSRLPTDLPQFAVDALLYGDDALAKRRHATLDG